MYHLWTIGDLQGAEHLAAQAMMLWPQHPAVWMARFWTLMFTERADQARRMIFDEQCRTFLPAPLIDVLQRTAHLVHLLRVGEASDEELQAHKKQTVELASVGPAQSVAALMSLCAVDAIDEAYEVAFGYYLGTGRWSAPLRWQAGDPSITDQHRRVTQPLFIPSGQCLRKDPRFAGLCSAMGLSAYWDRFGITPDHLAVHPLRKPTVR